MVTWLRELYLDTADFAGQLLLHKLYTLRVIKLARFIN